MEEKKKEKGGKGGWKFKSYEDTADIWVDKFPTKEPPPLGTRQGVKRCKKVFETRRKSRRSWRWEARGWYERGTQEKDENDEIRCTLSRLCLLIQRGHMLRNIAISMITIPALTLYPSPSLSLFLSRAEKLWAHPEGREERRLCTQRQISVFRARLSRSKRDIH